MLVEAGSRNGCSSCLSCGLFVERSTSRLSLGRTTACALPGLNSFHSYRRSSPFVLNSISDDCAAVSTPGSVLNWELATLPLLLWTIKKVSVATRRPFTKTPNEPLSTFWPAGSFSLAGAAAANAMNNNNEIVPSTTKILTFTLGRSWSCIFFLETKAACGFRRDHLDIFSTSLNPQRCLYIGWAA